MGCGPGVEKRLRVEEKRFGVQEKRLAVQKEG